MRALSRIVISISLLCSLAAFTDEPVNTTTGGALIAVISPDLAAELPKKTQKLRIDELRTTKKEMSFYLEGVFVHIEMVEADNVLLRLNGVPFTKSEVATYELAVRSLKKKFSRQPRAASLWNLFIPQAHAETNLSSLFSLLNPIMAMGSSAGGLGMLMLLMSGDLSSVVIPLFANLITTMNQMDSDPTLNSWTGAGPGLDSPGLAPPSFSIQ